MDSPTVKGNVMRPVLVPTMKVTNDDHPTYRLRLLWCVFQHICRYELDAELRQEMLRRLTRMLPDGPADIQPEKDQKAEILNELENPTGIHLQTGAAIQSTLLRKANRPPPPPPSSSRGP